MLPAILLYATMLIVAEGASTWCGQPECPPKPKCSNAELDLVIAMDSSCSMARSDWNQQQKFAYALANASEKKFNVSRFAGIYFGYNFNAGNLPYPKSAKIFHNMSAGALSLNQSLPGFNCGGTPTDEALNLFDAVLSTSNVGRMQMAVLLTDGIPTLCYTTGGYCDGTLSSAEKATNASIAVREDPTKLRRLGSLMMTVGIGSDLSTTIGNTPYGLITGRDLLTRFASHPRMAFFPTDFNVLVTQTLGQVLDMLCFYLIQVDSPPKTSCYGSGTMFVIRGYNFFSLGNVTCRWQEVGTTNYLYTNASVTDTAFTVPGDPGTIGLVNCASPVVTSDPFNAILEISRDGTYYTKNEYSVLLRNDCSAPVPPRQCPVSLISAFFSGCTPADFANNTCTSGCKTASDALGAYFADQGPYIPGFNASAILACLTAQPTVAPWTSTDVPVVAGRTGAGNGPCTTSAPTMAPTDSTVASGAGTLAAFLSGIISCTAVLFV